MALTFAAKLADIEEDEPLAIQLGDQHIALYLLDGKVYATHNVCTHQFALLSDGYMEDGCIECPLHQARFDIRTGKAMCAPATGDIRTYPVKIEDSRVWVEL